MRIGEGDGRASARGRGEYAAYADQLAAASPWSRGFETLLGSLAIAGSERPLRSLLLTSAAPGEGKTVVAANLAIALARAGRRVLLVDADLHRPRLHRVFGCEPGPGLADLLLGCAEPAACTRRIEIPTRSDAPPAALAFAPSGASPHASIAGVEPGRLAKVIESFTGAHDAVLLDTPPVLALSDALLLAPHVDGVLLVAASGGREREAQRAKLRIEAAGGHIVGVVMNAVDDAEGPKGYHPHAGAYAARAR
jgi:capsular exopolysaccharide synthesis family protein